MRNVLLRLQSGWKLSILLVLVCVTFSYAMFQGGFVSWFLFYSFVPFALYGLALSTYHFHKIQVRRIVESKDYKAGETLHVSIHLKRKFPFPLFLMVIEEQMSKDLRESLSNKEAKTLLFPYFQREIIFTYDIEELPRGQHSFEGVKIKVSDLLGLIEKEVLLPTTMNQIVVYPAMERIQYQHLNHHYEQGLAAAKETVQRDTSMAVGIREYQPGDRFSWINWKATAKRNDLITKEFEQRSSQDVLVVMDCSPQKEFESVVSFAASLVKAMMRAGVEVGFRSYSDTMTSFAITNGVSHERRIQYHLAKVCDHSDVPFHEVIEAEYQALSQHSHVFFLTSQLTSDITDKVRMLSNRRNPLTLFVVNEKLREPIPIGVPIVQIEKGHFQAAFSGVKSE